RRQVCTCVMVVVPAVAEQPHAGGKRRPHLRPPAAPYQNIDSSVVSTLRSVVWFPHHGMETFQCGFPHWYWCGFLHWFSVSGRCRTIYRYLHGHLLPVNHFAEIDVRNFCQRLSARYAASMNGIAASRSAMLSITMRFFNCRHP